MDDNLETTLLSAESDFLVALGSDAQMVASYSQTWSQLFGVLHTASKAGTISKGTSSLIHAVASRILEIANCYMHVKHTEEHLTMQLRVDRDTMIQRMDVLNVSAHPESSRSDNSPDVCSSTLLPTSASDKGYSSPPFLAPAHRWLLDNLHSPYPTADVKKRLAFSSSCQVSSISSWFTNARRRIGWTTLCRERFSNCRADMLDAAYRALVKEDTQRILSPELRHSFVAIKVAAESLCPSIFTNNVFADGLDAIAKDITNSGTRKSPQAEQANTTKTACDPYPSPNRSAPGTPVSALDNSLTDESEEDVAPPIIAGSKRRRSSIEPVNQDSSASRPIKRLRVSETPLTCLPSPPTSTDGTDTPLDNDVPEPSSVQSIQPETSIVSPSRKRRLSDADATDLSKRPRVAMAASLPHIVSDPLAHPNSNDEHSVDNWFNANFDALFTMPPPVEAAQPDSSTLWDVELFRDYSIPGNSKHASNCAPAPIDTHIPLPTDFTDLDRLLQSIGGQAFVAPLGAVASSAPEIPAIPYSSTPDMPQISIDWTSFLNSTDVHPPAVYPTFSPYPIDPQPLPEIDLSMLQLPSVIPTANSQGIVSKHAKLQQFHAMQEAVRQMERELQSEGVIA